MRARTRFQHSRGKVHAEELPFQTGFTSTRVEIFEGIFSDPPHNPFHHVPPRSYYLGKASCRNSERSLAIVIWDTQGKRGQERKKANAIRQQILFQRTLLMGIWTRNHRVPYAVVTPSCIPGGAAWCDGMLSTDSGRCLPNSSYTYCWQIRSSSCTSGLRIRISHLYRYNK